MPRRRKTLTKDQRAQVEALAAYLSQDQIADYFGMTRTTFAAIVDRDDDVSIRYKKGKAKAVLAVAQGLLQKARNGDTTCMIFYLKTQAGWRETNHIDHTSSDGSMAPAVDASKLSDDTIRELMAARTAADDGAS